LKNLLGYGLLTRIARNGAVLSQIVFIVFISPKIKKNCGMGFWNVLYSKHMKNTCISEMSKGKEAVIAFPGGAQVAGLVFIPTASPDHDGPMRAVEWLNSEDDFFPFQARGEGGLALVNKRNVVCLTAYHERDSGGYDEVDGALRRAVRVEALRDVFSGRMVIDTPGGTYGVLDALNDGRRFIYLLDGGKEIHINKNFITKAVEIESSESAGTV
jgi:hypothetical protein